MCAQARRLPYELHNKAVKKALPPKASTCFRPRTSVRSTSSPNWRWPAGSRKSRAAKSPEYVQAVGRPRDVLDRTQAWLAAQPEGADLPAVPQSLRATGRGASRPF